MNKEYADFLTKNGFSHAIGECKFKQDCDGDKNYTSSDYRNTICETSQGVIVMKLGEEAEGMHCPFVNATMVKRARSSDK